MPRPTNLSKILRALDNIESPFTSLDLSILTGIETKSVAGFLKYIDNIERIPVCRDRGHRLEYKVI